MRRLCCEGPFALNLLLSLVCHSSDLLTSGHTSLREGEKHLKGFWGTTEELSKPAFSSG